MSGLTRGGWTLHEMLISLVVLSGVMALAAQVATGQLRFFRSSAQLATLRGDASQASGIAAAVLRGISPEAGDILAALDSAVEIRMATGSAIICASSAGTVTIPQTSGPQGNTLAAFSELPEPGDLMFALQSDSAGESWSSHFVRESEPITGSCATLPGASIGRVVGIESQLPLQPGTAVRFARVFRLSLYRSSDSRWYLGGREWNGESHRFNTIQPVAGPLSPYHPDVARTGLHFAYLDSSGQALGSPIDTRAIAMIRILARASSGPWSDSIAETVALRNGR